jgi:hypothetical protein
MNPALHQECRRGISAAATGARFPTVMAFRRALLLEAAILSGEVKVLVKPK